ncbi:MAG: hypothetical protein ACRDL8_09410, partial [Solirubrobacteraceae bacterium]
MDNLVSLCSRHHHRLHEGGYRVESSPEGRLSFYRPDGRLIAEICAPPPLPAGSAAGLADLAP